MKIPREFYLRDTRIVARELLGQILVHETPEGVVKGRIVETEAYLGREDAACHSAKGDPKGRTAVMHGPGGFAYVYLIYGMYCCMNAVTREAGEPQAVLIRAVEPLEGVGLMEARRGTAKQKNLCNGPGKLCIAMGINRDQNGADLTSSNLYIEYGPPADFEIVASKRINVDYAGADAQLLLRYTIG